MKITYITRQPTPEERAEFLAATEAVQADMRAAIIGTDINCAGFDAAAARFDQLLRLNGWVLEAGGLRILVPVVPPAEEKST